MTRRDPEAEAQFAAQLAAADAARLRAAEEAGYRRGLADARRELLAIQGATYEQVSDLFRRAASMALNEALGGGDKP